MILLWTLVVWLQGLVVAETHLYEFNITTAADKEGKTFISINGRTDTLGPTLRVKSGDQVNLLVNNEICEQNYADALMQDYCSTSIHFHGLILGNDGLLGALHDGVPGVTQHSIPSHMSYWYNFSIPKNVCGTYWYHSHSSVQYGDGLRGLFLVECEERDKYINRVATRLEEVGTTSDAIAELPTSGQDLKIQEEVIAVSDWYSKSSIDILREVMAPNGDPDPRVEGSTTNGDTGSVAFVVDEETQYIVFRVVNMGMSGTNVLHIDGHRMCVIETDGILTKPYMVDTLAIAPGQRFSVLLKVESRDPIKIIHGCSKMMGYITKTHWILRSGQLRGNAFTGRIRDLPGFDVAERYLDYVPISGSLLPEPAQQISLDYDFADEIREPFETPMYVVNGNTMNEYFSEGLLILGDRGRRDPILLEAEQVVEIAINSIDHMRHPWHMHGHTFQVVSVGQKRDGPLHFNDADSPAMRRYKQDVANWGDRAPMTRDTINIPGHSYAVIRFVANNPGYWLLHCHVEWHMAKGLGVVFQEGDLEVSTLSIPEPFEKGKVKQEQEANTGPTQTSEPVSSGTVANTGHAESELSGYSSADGAIEEESTTATSKIRVLIVYICIMCIVNLCIWHYGLRESQRT